MTGLPVLSLIDAAIRGGLLALLLLSAWRFGRDHAHLALGRVGLAFMLGLSIQVVVSTPAFETRVPCHWQAPGVGVSVGNSVMFWLFSLALFVDGFRIRARHVVAWLVVFALGASFCVAFDARTTAPGLATLHWLAMRWAPACFAALAIVAAVSHWRDDLVEQRRGVRLYIVVAGSVYTMAMVLARLATADGRLGAGTAALDMAGLLGVIGVATASMLRFTDLGMLTTGAGAGPPVRGSSAAAIPRHFPGPSSGPISGPIPATIADSDTRADAGCGSLTGGDDVPGSGGALDPVADAADSRLQASFERLMTGDRAYSFENLSVASLAARLAVPEYRLRRVINQRLGHRNFNVYVNGYRLAEAKARLADPAQRELPILTIALDSGFQSIGPFNRAFKLDTGLTPSEFRRVALENSADSSNRPAGS